MGRRRKKEMEERKTKRERKSKLNEEKEISLNIYFSVCIKGIKEG